MPRSVNHVASRARRKNLMKLAKGYFGRRKNVWTVAKNAIENGYASYAEAQILMEIPLSHIEQGLVLEIIGENKESTIIISSTKLKLSIQMADNKYSLLDII